MAKQLLNDGITSPDKALLKYEGETPTTFYAVTAHVIEARTHYNLWKKDKPDGKWWNRMIDEIFVEAIPDLPMLVAVIYTYLVSIGTGNLQADEKVLLEGLITRIKADRPKKT